MTHDVKNTEYVFLIFTCSYRFGSDDLDVYGILTMTQDVKNTEYVFLIFTCSYRFGRDDLDVLGLTFQKELLLYTKCLWPNHPFDDNSNTKGTNKKWNKTWKKIKRLSSKRKTDSNEQISCTITNDDPYGIFSETLKETDLLPFQTKLLSKHGDLAFPFRINLYGVSYTLTAFAGQKLHSSQPIRFAVELLKKFYLDILSLIYQIINVEYFLVTEMYLLTRGTYRCTISEHLCKENLPQAGEQQWKYTTALDTSFTDSILKQGVALEGYIKQEKNWLASSTILKLSSDFGECLEMMQNIQKNVEESTETAIKANKELHGVVISYFVRPIENQSEDKQPIEIPHKDQD
ncbi:hypothetical protein Smp_152280 [Schistosoma mansoni]|uniref:hypothetical protein n=1 Tax=Schistosoma mansoni TaxID=6183 RepID=UPI0001A6453D|nr:hypothetical protein Smp_152280 [Schistosoma mansoni]|eukprot:XP_018647573.1 hypothetical protein Smp_152280 [Schistosoma mansoni]